MFFSQARRLPGLHLVGVVDLDRDKAVQAFQRAEWPAEQFAAGGVQEALRKGSTWLSEDSEALLSAEGVEVIVEATGDPVAGIAHALRAIDHGRHLVMVNVEADVVAGPLLARRARRAGVVYSLAYGDQPALICELVDWARCSGFEVVCAGKGTKYLPRYHAPRRIRSGNTMDSTRRRWRAASSIRECSIPFWTAPSRRSRWLPWPTPPAFNPSRKV